MEILDRFRTIPVIIYTSPSDDREAFKPQVLSALPFINTRLILESFHILPHSLPTRIVSLYDVAQHQSYR